MTEALRLESKYSVIHFAFESSFQLHEKDRRQTEVHESLKCALRYFAQYITGHTGLLSTERDCSKDHHTIFINKYSLYLVNYYKQLKLQKQRL